MNMFWFKYVLVDTSWFTQKNIASDYMVASWHLTGKPLSILYKMQTIIDVFFCDLICHNACVKQFFSLNKHIVFIEAEKLF